MKWKVALAFDTLSRFSGPRSRPHIIVAVLVVARLWLAAGQTISAVGSSPHDDFHFLLLAAGLLSGEWLGGYDELTLIKGPFFPMWIAAAFELGIPLLFAAHALYVTSCAVLVRALYPALRSTGARLALLGVLLFNPASCASNIMNRVLRESIYCSLTLFVLAAGLGLALRQDRPFRRTLPWIIGLGVSLAAYYLCREERVWLLPSLLLVLSGALALSASAWRATVLRIGIALTIFVVLVGAVVLKNGVTYGSYVVTELTEGPFVRAYRALVSVRPATDRPYVPLPAEVRKRIYAVSPRFAELAPYLEADAGRAWSVHGCQALGICDDIAAGWMLWALRAAAAAAHHYKRGSEAARYWAEVATDVDQACADGRLVCEVGGVSLLPPLRRVDLQAFCRSMARAMSNVAFFEGITFQSDPSEGSVAQLDVFRDLTRTRLAPDPQIIEKWLGHQDALLERKEALLQWDLVLYRATTPWLAGAALLAFGVTVVSAVCDRRIGGSLLAAGTFLVGVVSRVAVVAIVDSTSFPSVNASYLSPTYALVVGFVALTCHAVVEAAGVRTARGRTP